MPGTLDQVRSCKHKHSLRVGFMGLIDQSWMDTSKLKKEDFCLGNYEKVGKGLSEMLKRDFDCDIIIALTHMRNVSDIELQNGQNQIDFSKLPIPA